jgi:hypothetical protein
MVRHMLLFTGLFVRSGDETFYLDDPKDRQRYVRYLNPKQREKFAKFYLRKLIEAKEYDLWYKKMLLKK